MEIYNLISFLGIFVLMALAWSVSTDHKNINWHVIVWSIGMQLVLAVFIFLIPAGSKLFLWINTFAIKILETASEGAKFAFGPLALPPGTEGSFGFILAFQGFPTIIFFSALVAILYYWNILPRIIRGFAWLFTKLMKVSGAESLCTASNIFVGIESTLTIKPHLENMTKSELCTVLTAGMATVASNVLVLYTFALKEQFPTIAGHLISASIISAPAALVMSKLLLPESSTPVTLGESIRPHYEKENNLFEAVINSAQAGVKMIVGIVAMLIAVVGLVALVDLALGSIGGWLNLDMDFSLKGLLGYLFYPLTIIIGVPPSDAMEIAKIIGERMVVTEVVAYQDLANLLAQGKLLHPRSAVIATYALCGFAHLASMAIFVGGITAIAPKTKTILSKIAFRALLAATLACLMTACIAGTFFTEGSILLGN